MPTLQLYCFRPLQRRVGFLSRDDKGYHMYKCSYFKIHELVSPEIYDVLGEELCWHLLPDIVKQQLDAIREEFYSYAGMGIIINNWGFGGQYKYSGVRPKNCKIGAPNSKHKQWVAFDLKASKIHRTDELQEFIKHMGKSFNISRIENFEHTPSWVHIEIYITGGVVEPIWFNP